MPYAAEKPGAQVLQQCQSDDKIQLALSNDGATTYSFADKYNGLNTELAEALQGL